MKETSPTDRKRVDPFDWLLGAVPSRGVQYLLALASAFSLFGALDEVLAFAKWIARWVEYWGAFWAWALNGIFQWISIEVTQSDANVISAMIILFAALYRGEIASIRQKLTKTPTKLTVFIGIIIAFVYAFILGFSAIVLSADGMLIFLVSILAFVIFMTIASTVWRWDDYKKSNKKLLDYSFGLIKDINLHYQYSLVFIRIAIAFFMIFAINLAVTLYEKSPPFPDN